MRVVFSALWLMLKETHPTRNFKGSRSSADAEAVRVVSSIKGFVPGKQNGNPVEVYYQLPINFALPN